MTRDYDDIEKTKGKSVIVDLDISGSMMSNTPVTREITE
jgi:hypothetical protein